jgi:hypothetical protein
MMAWPEGLAQGAPRAPRFIAAAPCRGKPVRVQAISRLRAQRAEDCRVSRQ